MLKAFNPVAILLISWATRLKEPNRKIGIIVFAISSGVALASKGELKFDLVGFLIQAVAVAVRAFFFSCSGEFFYLCVLIFYIFSLR